MRKILVLIGLLCQLTCTYAAAVKFVAKVSRSTVEVGERFQITFTLNKEGKKFIPPPFYKFRLISGPNHSSRMQYVNGKMSSSVSYSYILQAREIGEFTIGGASVLVDGKNYKTQPLKMKVVKASKTSARGVKNQGQQRKEAGKDLKDYVFVKAIVDKSSAYVGEKVTLTYKLYSRLTLTGLNLEKLPALNGFWSQDIRTIYDQIELERENVNGVTYSVAELQKTVLYPQRSGELTIDPMEIKVTVRTKSNRRLSVFDQIFGSYESKELVLGSKVKKVKIKALPIEGKPSDFSGAVGSFEMRWEISKDSLKANEAIDLKVTIDGKGNFPLVASPKLNFPSDFESYDPEVGNNYSTDYSGTAGNKTFKYLVIPRHSGEFVIEPYTFSYFDLAKKAYRNITTKPLHIRVGKGVEENNLVYRGSRKEEVEILNSDIRYIHLVPTIFVASDQLFYKSFLFYSLIVLALLLMMGAYFLMRAYASRNSDFGKMRKTNANKVAKKHLKKASSYLEKNEKERFYEEISIALHGYFADKFNISVAELSQEKITELLESVQGAIEIKEGVKKVLEDAEMARFAPNSALSAEDFYRQAVSIISKTESLEI